jgi:hypothetical protein
LLKKLLSSLRVIIFQIMVPQTKNGFFAQMQPDAETERREKFMGVAAQFPLPHNASWPHGFLLAGGTARPVLPVQVFFAFRTASRNRRYGVRNLLLRQADASLRRTG